MSGIVPQCTGHENALRFGSRFLRTERSSRGSGYRRTRRPATMTAASLLGEESVAWNVAMAISLMAQVAEMPVAMVTVSETVTADCTHDVTGAS